MKTVFSSNSQVAHVWASQTQELGRSGSMFFEGDKIYSYGYHYLAARIYTNESNEQLALMNEYTYSNSTGKHLGKIRSALYGRMEYIAVPKPGDLNDIENEIYLTNRVCEVLSDAFNSRTRYVYSEGLQNSIETLNQFLKFRDGKKFKAFELDADTLETFNTLVKEKEVKQEERNVIKNKALAELRKKYQLAQIALEREYAVEIALWPKNQNTKHIPSHFFPKNFDMIRLHTNGKEVETSRGAQVPLAHAKRLLGLVKQGRVKVGDRVGHFTVDRVNEKTLKIGCHVINIDQAEEVLGLVPDLKVVE